MSILKNIIAIILLTIGIIGLRFGLEHWLMPDIYTHEHSTITNLTNPESDGFKQGDALEVQLFFKNPDPTKDSEITLTPEYSYRFGLKENSLTVDGKPFQGNTITIPAGADPVHVRYEAIANGNTGDPRRLMTIAETSTPVTTQVTTQHSETPSLDTCPSPEIVHNSDALLILQGTGLEHGIQIENQALIMSRKQNNNYWFTLPQKTLSDGTHELMLRDAGGALSPTNCFLTSTIYNRPFVLQITPSELTSGNAQRILIQGEQMHTVTQAELRGQTNYKLSFELLDEKVLSVIIPATVPAGTYTLALGDQQQLYTTSASSLTIRPTN